MMLSWKSPGATSRLPLQWSQWPPKEPAFPSTFLAFHYPHLALQPHCWQLGTCHSQSSVLEGPPMARNCSLYFVEYLIIFFFFFSPLPSWDCDPPPSSRDRIRARDPCGIPPKPTSPKVIRPDNISSSVGGRLGTQGALGSQHSLRPVPDLSQQPPKLAVGFYGFLQWIKDSTRVLSPPHLPSLPVLRSSAGAAGPLVG